MRDKQTLFDYVYQDLRGQIVSGRLSFGDKLPSMRSLCDLYNVGLRTIKDVLRVLKEEAFIRTEERKAAIVIYRQSEDGSAVRSVLKRRTTILLVYQTIAVLMPPFLAFSAQFCEEGELKQFNERMKKQNAAVPDRSFISGLYWILDHSNNHLFRELFSSLGIYARMPFFGKDQRFVELAAEHRDFLSVSWVMESLIAKDTDQIVERFGNMFRSITDMVSLYLEEMSVGREDAEERDQVYTWKAERGRDYYYTQITRDLIDKIGTGVYQEGTFLPSEAELSKEYGVCVSTVRSAVAMLNELGFGRTLNARGTIATLQSDQSVSQILKRKIYRKDIILYLSGLQLMAIAVRPAALLVFDLIGEKEIQDLEEQIKEPETIPLDRMVQCVIDHQTLQPLQAILQEVKGKLYWGYYFSFYNEGALSGDLLTQKSMAAFERLRQGDGDGFADALAECYCHILDFVRAYMVDFGLAEAEKLVSPCSESQY